MTHRTTPVVQYYVQLNEMFQNDRKGIIKGRFKSLNLLDSRNRSLGIGDRHTVTDRHHKQCKMYYKCLFLINLIKIIKDTYDIMIRTACRRIESFRIRTPLFRMKDEDFSQRRLYGWRAVDL